MINLAALTAGRGPGVQALRPRITGLLLAVALFLTGCSGSPPQAVGPLGNDLRPCPGTPNCVHTGRGNPPEAPDFPLAAEWQGGGSVDEILDQVEAALTSLPRTQVVEALTSLPRTQVVDRRANYLRAEATSRIFRFVDDVEVLVPPGEERLVVRSASRMGRSDLGVNLNRVRELHETLTESGLITTPPNP